jgi:hypothetical protein
MQITTDQTNSLKIAQETLKGEGVLGLYKGLLAPLFGVVPYNALVFTLTDFIDVQLEQMALASESKKALAGGLGGG